MHFGLLSLLTACNQYEYFNIAGYEQASFTNQADILFVIDNSSSMRDESVALGTNFNTFINYLTSEDGAGQSFDDLDDAVDNYVSFVAERGRYIDFQLGITTTSVDYSVGPTSGPDPGEAGLLLGDPTVIEKTNADVGGVFRSNLMCNATYWERNLLPSDPDYTCGDETENISVEYLDCICNSSDWDGLSGSGNEEPLEAAYMALCRSVENPPEECNNPIGPFSTGDEMSNENFLREDSAVVIVVITDEGDNSRRIVGGVNSQNDPKPYMDLFDEFERRISWAVIGPNYDPNVGDFSCNSGGGQDWMVERLRTVAEESNGFYRPLEVMGDDGCEQADFSVHLEKLGELLNNLDKVFKLRSVPDVSSIRVYVNGEEIDEAPMINEAEYASNPIEVRPVYGDGWSYESSENAVVFWGESVPDYNSEVRIYYRPLAGTPRDLPFTY